MNSPFWEDFFFDLEKYGKEYTVNTYSDILVSDLKKVIGFLSTNNIEELEHENAITVLKQIINSIEVES